MKINFVFILLLIVMLFKAQAQDVRFEISTVFENPQNEESCRVRFFTDTTQKAPFIIIKQGSAVWETDSMGYSKGCIPGNTVDVYRQIDKDLKFEGTVSLANVYEMPRPTAKISGRVDGDISFDSLVNARITADFSEFDFNCKYEIIEFRFVIMRKKRSILTGTSNGCAFSNEQKNDIVRLSRPGDTILFYNIKSDAQYFLNIILNSIYFTIK